MKINSDYNDLLRLFDEFGVRYLIAGSYAVMKYTEPTWSKDIDLWIDPVPENAVKVLDALRRFGAPLNLAAVGEARKDIAEINTAQVFVIQPRTVN